MMPYSISYVSHPYHATTPPPVLAKPNGRPHPSLHAVLRPTVHASHTRITPYQAGVSMHASCTTSHVQA
jgi:hypothetical protein